MDKEDFIRDDCKIINEKDNIDIHIKNGMNAKAKIYGNDVELKFMINITFDKLKKLDCFISLASNQILEIKYK